MKKFIDKMLPLCVNNVLPVENFGDRVATKDIRKQLEGKLVLYRAIRPSAASTLWRDWRTFEKACLA